MNFTFNDLVNQIIYSGESLFEAFIGTNETIYFVLPFVFCLAGFVIIKILKLITNLVYK